MKKISFLGDSLKRIKAFSVPAKQDAGYQLDKIQCGKEPDDSKPMPTIGKGVEEIRIWDEAGTYRIIYTARIYNTVYVLHAFKKKTQKTPKKDIDLAKLRFNELTRILS
jgi:phage-related protein